MMKLLLALPFAAPLAAQPTSIRPLVPSGPRKEQQVFGPAAAVPASARGVRDRGELAAFLDGVMTANLRDKHVAGATVAVVKDGALFYANGYGYSDVAHRTPVSADRSLFRIGSTSKLFTWTAVMQLVEQGKLDLDTDVNKYIDFKIPSTYQQPITLRHIMTHTPGFEEDGRDLITDDSTRLIPLGRWLATDMAKFMLAHLGNGAYNGQRILAESTAVRMHSRAFSHDPRLPGFALGFYEKSSHGLRIIGHGGDTQWFHTDLALVPDEKLGVFVSYNTSTGGELSFGPFLAEFLDHYYTTPATTVALPADAAKEAARVAGEYEFNRRSYT